MNVRLSIVTDTSIGRDLTLKKDKENPVRSSINMPIPVPVEHDIRRILQILKYIIIHNKNFFITNFEKNSK